METKKNSQFLMPLILLSVLFSQTLAFPPMKAEALSNDVSERQGPIRRQVDLILIDIYTRFPQQIPENDLKNLLGKKRCPAKKKGYKISRQVAPDNQ